MLGAAYCSRPKVVVTVDGRGEVNHAGARLLANLADATGLSEAKSEAPEGVIHRRGGCVGARWADRGRTLGVAGGGGLGS